MRNLWSDSHTHDLDELDKLVYMSRLIGEDQSLVLWGGGNTSIKVLERDFRGRDVSAMWIKGSGSDMKTIEHRQFPLHGSSFRLLVRGHFECESCRLWKLRDA